MLAIFVKSLHFIFISCIYNFIVLVLYCYVKNFYVICITQITGEGFMKFTTVFGPDGKGPADYYRIPSVVTTDNGVVVACADARYCSGMDNPNRIDKVVRRSTDNGKTWSDYIIAVKEHGTVKMKSSAAIDPVMTYDSATGRIYLLYSHTPAGVGIRNSACSKGFDSQGRKFLKSGFKKYILQSGSIYTLKMKKTKYTADKNGDVFADNKKICNFYTGGKFKELNTSYLMMCYSDDDGKSWSEPVCINSKVKEDYMSFIGPGPGCGIVINQGKYKGRIVVPVYFGTRVFPLRLSCTVVYSDDNGKTWKLGNSPNNSRERYGRQLNCMTVKSDEMLTESQLIEQKDGVLKLFMRNHDKRRRVAVAYSYDGGENWEDFRFDETLPQPICQSAVIKLRNTEKPTVVLVNPSDEKKRCNGTVMLSYDDGETFPYRRVLKKDDFVYSSITQLPNGNIGVLFEPDSKCREILFAEISLDWIENKQ